MKKGPLIILDEDARDVGLAEIMVNLIRQNLDQKPKRMASFAGLRIIVFLTARDIGITITLAFRKGKLTVYNGAMGIPDLRIVADHDIILELSLIRIWLGIPNTFDKTGREVLKNLLSGRLRIEGLLRHPLQLTRLTRVISVN